MKVVIIGSGNVATVLGKKILTANNQVVQIVARNVEEGHRLGAILNASVVYNLRYINPFADIYIIAVADGAIEDISKRLKVHDKIVVHTAASVSKDILAQSSVNYGVLYPLQSLRKETVSIPPIPVLVDACNEQTMVALKEFSSEWADSVEVASDEERLKIHVAAVIVSNFVNHLFAISEEFCKVERLNFNLLHPLIEEVSARIRLGSPSGFQTGPAIRKDHHTIRMHEEVLAGYPKMQELYKMLTMSILEFYNNKSVEEKNAV